MNEVITIFLVEVNNHLGVRMVCAKCVSLLLQPLSQLLEIVDLPIEDHPKPSVLVVHGLAAGFEIDDTEPSDAQVHFSVRIKPFFIRAPVNDGVRHPLEYDSVLRA